MDWFPWYPADYKRDTYNLTLAEDGAYRRLIDEYMANAGPLPSDDHALARIIGVNIDTWLQIADNVRRFFHTNPQGQLTHKRCDQELRRQAVVFARNSARGQKAAIKRWSKNNTQHARRMLTPNTLHNNIESRTSFSETSAAREAPTQPQPDGSLATALPTGALARHPTSNDPKLTFSKSLEQVVRDKGWVP